MSEGDGDQSVPVHHVQEPPPGSPAAKQSLSPDAKSESSQSEPIQIVCHDQSPSIGNDSPAVDSVASATEPADVRGSPFVLDRNPSPPTVGSDQVEEHGDVIGDTVFSKHWVFTTLMRLIREGEKEDGDEKEDQSGASAEDNPQKKQADNCEDKPSTGSRGDATPEELDKELENELCKLWDMSMNKDVALFLHQWKMVSILIRVIKTTNAPRATEICVGILANMACNEENVVDMSEQDELITVVLALLECTDPPTLIETTRLIYTSVCNAQSSRHWITALKRNPSIPTTICFILQSSTNNDLIHNVSDLLDKLLDMDDELVSMWSSSDLVIAVCEAIQQVRGEKPTALEFLLHILQLLSTNEKGAAALVENGSTVFKLLADFLHTICSEETITLVGREIELAATVSLLDVLTTSNDSDVVCLEKDSRVTRCLLDIVHILRPQLRHRRKSTLSAEEEQENIRKGTMLQNVIINYMGSVLKSEVGSRIVCKQLKRCNELKVKSLKYALEKHNVGRDIIQTLEWEI